MGGKKGVEGVGEGNGEGWEPRYGNDSRPWLLGFQQEVGMPSSSTTHETFTADWQPPPRSEGVRRQLLKEALWHEARREVAAQMTTTEPEEAEPVSEYDGSFTKEGFSPEPIRTDPELHRKYPLYRDVAVSVWVDKLPALPGATRAPHISHQFRRYAGFTKPLDETLDDPLDPQ